MSNLPPPVAQAQSLEPRLEEFLDDLEVIVWDANPETGVIRSVSPNAEQILGYPLQEWQETDFLARHTHPEDSGLGYPKRKPHNGHGFAGGEFRLISAEGRTLWFRVTTRLILDAAGCPASLRGVLQNITLQKRAEQALWESQERYRYLIDHAGDIIYRTDAEGRFTFFNTAAPSLLRWKAEQLFGLPYLELVRPDFRPKAKRFYVRQFRTRTPSTYMELPVLTGDGGYVWLGQNVQLVFDGDKVNGFQAIARDLTEHKRAEATLIESEERYRVVAESATDAIITIDRDSRILFVNPSAEAIFGHSSAEMLEMSFFDLVPNYPRTFHQMYARLNLQTGQAYFAADTIEITGCHKSGHKIPLEISLGEFANGGRILFTAVIRDITERKRAAEAENRMDRRFRSLIEHAADVVIILDKDGTILYESPSLTRVLGYEPDLMVGGSAFDLLHPDDLPSAQDTFLAGQDSKGVPFPLTVRVRHADGSWRVCEALARNLIDDPSVRGVVVNLRDVTESRRVQEELRAANETLRALIQATPLAIVALDSSGLITKWNPAAQKIFGWTEAEVLGNPLPYFSDDVTSDGRELLEKLQRGESFSVERTRVRKSGERVLVSMSAAPLWAADGSICGSVAVITDVTERRRLEDQLRQAQKMEAVGQLAGGVAHDFNNLLTVITGYDQLLINTLPQNGKAQAYSEEIMNAAERACSLTRQLLAFSRRQMTQPKILDLNSVVNDMTKMLRRLIGENIDLITTLRPVLGKVHADPGQIEQIIMNLAVNARDAMPTGGKLFIETNEVVLDENYARTHVSSRPGPHVVLAVTDTGVGMDAETKRRIFEPFFTTKELGKGTGLGLSTVYGIVKQNNANIWVYSEPGIGSTFKIYFPAAAAGTQVERVIGVRPALEGAECVLVVEDEDGLRSLVKELLEQLGYRVLTARGGREALDLCLRGRLDIQLLLTDVVMPDMNGALVAERLGRFLPRMRVLYMSGYPDDTIVQHGVLGPGAAFLQKPFTQGTLAAKVREVLDAEVPIPS